VSSLRQRFLARETLLGCFLTSPTESSVELLALAQFDFLVIDTEHGFFNIESVERMVRAADSAGLPSVVRVPNCQASAETGRALDAGATGVLFPRADGVAAVKGAVESVKFGPIGKRGLAGVRANRYGTVPLDHYVVEATEATSVMIQIETAGALNVAEEIAAERYVDLLFVGPNDLSQALGVAGHYDDPRYRAAVQRVGAAAKAAGRGAGIMLRRTDQIADFAALGFHVFTTSDRTLLAESARSWRAALRKA
ncbi:MAG TPA: aldolase/citrate lyase family protein, partial [Thermoanaerobaculia bacterium]